MTELAEQIAAFDPALFSFIEMQGTDLDRRALLALHASVADQLGSFSYLEIGSYLGGSLQAVMRDPRCVDVISIDPRSASAPDKRSGTWTYEDNSTARMLSLLRKLPQVDMDKLATIESGTDVLSPRDLPAKPDVCFIDGEHTDESALRDARFCAEAVAGSGVIAFHDYEIVKPAIYTFLRDVWSEVSFAAAFPRASYDPAGGVFALELGRGRLMRSRFIDRVVESWWHTLVWKSLSGPPSPASGFLAAWRLMPRIDEAVLTGRQRMQTVVDALAKR